MDVITRKDQVVYENEEAVMAFFQKGDKDAFRSLYYKLYRPLLYFAENILRSQEDAEDIVANAFCKLFHVRTELRSFEHVRRWLYVIVRNASIDALRMKEKRKEILQEFVYLEEESEEWLETERAKAAVFESLLGQIEQLPGQRRIIIRLYFLEQKSTAEIAQIMGLNNQTVINHKNKALDSLRKSGFKLKHLLDGIPGFLLAWVIYWLK